MDLYSNQILKDDKVYTKFLFVHDDTFGRELTIEKIKEYIGVDFEMKVISKNNDKINVFLATIEGYFESDEDLPHGFVSLKDTFYYNIVSCNFNAI